MEDLVTGLTTAPGGLALDPVNDRMWWMELPGSIAYLDRPGAGPDDLFFLADPTVVDIPVPEVPAASRWVALALALVLLTGSSLRLRRR